MKFSKRLKYYGQFLKSLFRVNRGLLSGMWKLTKLKQPVITVFGGTRLQSDSIHSQRICELAKKLAGSGFSILTGGGPGIMEAANLGAFESKNHKKSAEEEKQHQIRVDQREIISMGISLEKLAQDPNKYAGEIITLPYFFTRKWLLVRYAAGFVVGPGGFGTLDELAEVLTLIQTLHMPRTPVVLIGVDYWQPLIDWIHDRALRDQLLTAEDAAIIACTDDVEEAFALITSKCTGFEECALTAKPKE